MIQTDLRANPYIPTTLINCLAALDQKKADQLRLMYVGEISSITEYFLIATGTSNPHLKALGEAVIEELDKADMDALICGAGDQSGWVVVDAYDFIIHLFTKDQRAYFNLEGLWKDARFLDCTEALEPAKKTG